jgi:hypothetical protein
MVLAEKRAGNSKQGLERNQRHGFQPHGDTEPGNGIDTVAGR